MIPIFCRLAAGNLSHRSKYTLKFQTWHKAGFVSKFIWFSKRWRKQDSPPAKTPMTSIFDVRSCVICRCVSWGNPEMRTELGHWIWRQLTEWRTPGWAIKQNAETHAEMINGLHCRCTSKALAPSGAMRSVRRWNPENNIVDCYDRLVRFLPARGRFLIVYRRCRWAATTHTMAAKVLSPSELTDVRVLCVRRV